MGFNIINASKQITNKYHRYLTTMFDINDVDYKEIFNKKIKEGNFLEKGPFLDVTNSFAKGRSIKDLIRDGIISKDFEKIDRLYNIPNLYYHQEEALLKALNGENLVVSTGTGSGKTECFLLPLINELMREKENGTLCDGVRALIIYPMNALANDQIDRLRKTFINYPDITFGCYTGQTKAHDKTSNNKGAIDQYLQLNGKRIDDERLRTPLKNERLSRESMKKNPPHILITNYAMLEFLMLRPDDNVFFDGEYANYWKYIILDEAHTYTGSTGIEVSMLLRRLLAKLNKKDVQFILTSATLGDKSSDDEVISFANNLCSVEFKKENIIRAKRVDLKQEITKYTLDASFYNEVNSLIEYGYDDNFIINEIENKYNFKIENKNLSEYLFDVLIYDSTFWKIKNFLEKPKSIEEIKKFANLSEEDVSAFVEVSSRAIKNQSKLFDSRYHMFLRATEGVFITLSPNKDLFLTRKNVVFKDDVQYKVFEAVTCVQCHAIYLLGYINSNSFLVQKSAADSDEIKEAFYLGNQINDSDEDNSLLNADLIAEKYELCPHCGFIRSEAENIKRSCGHDETHFVKVVKVKTKNLDLGRVTKCICCENVNRLGILRGFFTGQEASTSVIGTSLFEELPSHIKKVTLKTDNDFDGFDIDIGESVEEVAQAKQFIAFSDSRQSAAYFASYLSTSYDEILYGRLVYNTLLSQSNQQIEVNKFVDELTAVMEEKKIIPFDEYLHMIKANLISTNDYQITAWKALLKTFVDNAQRNSLIGLGLLNLNFNDKMEFYDHRKYELMKEEVKDICMVFVMGMLSDAAMHYPKNINSADREFFTHNGVEYSFLKESGGKYILSFIPQSETRSNKRLDYLMRILRKLDVNITKESVKKVLSQFWDTFFVHNRSSRPQIMFKDNEAHYTVNLENLVLEKNKRWYRCSKCNKLTTFNVKGVCPSYRCDGILEDVDVNALNINNHYYKLYHDLEIQPMRVVEHTAQLNREEAYNYQTLFKDQKIDVLSCSTTFEMGVDVGDLETVFMRNMPPSASNYAQRAGRAGRSSTSAAFALTFCNKSNHDFNYFERPIEMINGKIMPPLFKVENEKICIRHLYSSALSYFFKIYSRYFSNAKNMMENNEYTSISGYDALKEFLTTDSFYRNELKEYLLESIPEKLHEKFKIESFGWVDWLFSDYPDEYPSLKAVKEIYLKEISILKDELLKMKDNNNGSQINYLTYRIKTYEEESIINFLSKNNILPKYGFPVDTVELETNAKSKKDDQSGIELSRDLSMAISEYAPGCQVVANNLLITSRYIKKISNRDWRKYDYIECDNCKTLNVMPSIIISSEDDNRLCNCKQCKNALDAKKIKTFIIPEFGFIAEEKTEKPSLIKPEKTFRTEASFFSNDEDFPEQKYLIANTEISVAIIGNNGEMAMLNTTDFFVCPVCGYAIESQENPISFAKTFTKEHKNSRGYWCKSQLEKYSLGYKFKTDVIRIRINKPLLNAGDKRYEEAYSILQDLILSACKEANVENTEIAGCLQYYNHDGENYSYLLYDKTPGGAGHVKRLNNYEKIKRVLINAYNKSKNCPNCDEDASCYSCLRTYQNQKHHDIIKRKYVSDYLELVLNESSNNDDFNNDLLDEEGKIACDNERDYSICLEDEAVNELKDELNNENEINNLNLKNISSSIKTIFEDGAIDDDSIITRRKENESIEDSEPTSKNGLLINEFVIGEMEEEIPQVFPNILTKAINYDLSKISSQRINAAKAILDSNKFYDFEITDYNIAIKYKLENYNKYGNDNYLVNILLEGKKLFISCSCCSNLCVHSIAFIMYLKEKCKDIELK